MDFFAVSSGIYKVRQEVEVVQTSNITPSSPGDLCLYPKVCRMQALSLSPPWSPPPNPLVLLSPPSWVKLLGMARRLVDSIVPGDLAPGADEALYRLY